jgi:hypothetical protein
MLELRTPADVSLVELRRLASAKTRGVPVGGTAAGIRAMAIVPGTPFTDILSKEARAGVAAAVPPRRDWADRPSTPRSCARSCATPCSMV